MGLNKTIAKLRKECKELNIKIKKGTKHTFNKIGRHHVVESDLNYLLAEIDNSNDNNFPAFYIYSELVFAKRR